MDLPNKHTLTLLDWQEEASLDLFTQINSALGFYPGKPFGVVPTTENVRYGTTRSYDYGEIGPVPYFSGVINGLGRHEDVPYIQNRLSVFTVEQGNMYRFRLIGAQGLYAYRFSVDGHKLSVVATDGFWVEPVEEVDYIIIHTGERYDFLLNATETGMNYIMRAETLEVSIDENGPPPYDSLGHIAEAILHYRQEGEREDPMIQSSDYQNIVDQSPTRVCNATSPCKAVNCPFENFHSSYFINCTNVNDLKLLE